MYPVESEVEIEHMKNFFDFKNYLEPIYEYAQVPDRPKKSIFTKC